MSSLEVTLVSTNCLCDLKLATWKSLSWLLQLKARLTGTEGYRVRFELSGPTYLPNWQSFLDEIEAYSITLLISYVSLCEVILFINQICSFILRSSLKCRLLRLCQTINSYFPNSHLQNIVFLKILLFCELSQQSFAVMISQNTSGDKYLPFTTEVNVLISSKWMAMYMAPFFISDTKTN